MNINAVLYINSPEISQKHDAELLEEDGKYKIVYNDGSINISSVDVTVVNKASPGYALSFKKNSPTTGTISTAFGNIPVDIHTYGFWANEGASGVHLHYRISYRLTFGNGEMLDNEIEIVCKTK